MADKAVALGLSALTFTDHIDIDGYFGSDYRQSELMPEGVAQIRPLKEEYEGRIKIGLGAEIGQFMHRPELARSLIADFGLDYIIGSAHSVRGDDDFYYFNCEKDPEKLLRQYFEEILEMTENADIDVIGHLTYPLRYITGRCSIEIDMNGYGELIRRTFTAAAQRGLGLEINTQGLRKREYGKADPGIEYVKLFRETGGEIITVGSDAHSAADIAANFKEGKDIAEAAGFKRIAYYENRKPVFINI